MDSQTSLAILERKSRGVPVVRTTMAHVPSLFTRRHTRLTHTMQQPDFFIVGIDTPYTIENDEYVITGRVCHFSTEVLHLGRVISASGVTTRVVISAGFVVSDFHFARVPKVSGAIEVLTTPHSVPIARRIHSLTTIIGGRP